MAKLIKRATELEFKVENGQENINEVEQPYEQELNLVKSNYSKAIELENLFDRKEFRKGIKQDRKERRRYTERVFQFIRFWLL